MLDCCGLDKGVCGELCLEILDISGKPLEGVDFVNALLGGLRDDVMKLRMTQVRRYTERKVNEELHSKYFLVQSAEIGKKGENGLDSLFANRILELLAQENAELFDKRISPTRQIFPSFLYRKGYWAILSLPDSNGSSCKGFLKPFTIHSQPFWYFSIGKKCSRRRFKEEKDEIAFLSEPHMELVLQGGARVVGCGLGRSLLRKWLYSHNLKDVVDKIYDQMNLLPFGEEDEDQALMFNSEDINQSWREKNDKHDILASKRFQESLSLEDESSHPLENLDTKLNEACERRERARRFVSFTRRMPDLQRVWAPKQSKAVKVKPENKRKKQKRGSYIVVCETPMVGNNPSSSTRQNKGNRSKTSNSVCSN
nr:putative treslin [Tanacetum cinerariifolium]